MNFVLKPLISVHFMNTFLIITCSSFGIQRTIKWTSTDPEIYTNTPKQCPEGMKGHYYYFKTGVAWTCECQYGRLFFRETQSCHYAYTRGDCKKGEYFILPAGEETPRCEKNPCNEDWVPSDGGCKQLKRTGPRASDSRETTDQKMSGFYHRTLRVFCFLCKFPESDCPPGQRRDSAHICRKQLSS